MESRFPNPDRIVYVDVEFVAQKYEQITGTPAQSVMTRTEGGQAGIKAFFASAGVHTQESRTYPMSSTMMLEKVFDKLKKDYSRLNLEGWENGKGTCVGWIDGNLSTGEWSGTENSQDKDRHEYYEMHCGNRSLTLLPQIDYFYPGFCDLLRISEALKSNIDFPVEMLARILYYTEVGKSYVCAPLLVYESSTASK